MNGSSGRRRVSFAAVATDDERIFAAVQAFGGRAVMTSPRHRSGTDRIAEAVETLGLEDDDIVVNIQGDQPLFEPAQVDEVVGPLLEDPSDPHVHADLPDRPRRGDHPPERRQGRLRQPTISPSTSPAPRSPSSATGEKGRLLQAPRDLRLPPRISCAPSPPCRRGSWSAWRPSNSSGRSNTATGSRWSSRPHDSVEVDTPEELERVRRLITGEEQS